MRRLEENARNRVLVIESAGNLWGSERVLLDLLAHRNCCDYAVCCPPNSPIIPELHKLGVKTFPFFIADLHQKTKFHRGLASIGVLLASLRFRPQLIYLNQSGCYRVIALACKLSGIPIVAHIRIVEDAAYLAACQPRPAQLKGIVAISHWIADNVRKEKGMADIPIHTLYDGFKSGSSSQTLAASKPVFKVACMGRVEKIKGQEVLLDALALLKQRGSPTTCRMIGSGGEFYQAQIERTSALGMLDEVEWTGFLTNPMEALQGVKLLIVPSRREPLGRVLFEGWAAGLVPVVYAGSGGAAEVVQSSGGGILYAEQEPGCLAKAIAKGLALTDGAHGNLVQLGQAWMAKNTDPYKYAAEMQRIFVESIGQ